MGWKVDKIKRSIMIGDYEDGGAKMADIVSFNRALNKNNLGCKVF